MLGQADAVAKDGAVRERRRRIDRQDADPAVLRAARPGQRADERRLADAGRAVLGRTRVDGAVALKLTLLNPLTTRDQIDALLDLVAAT